MENDPSWIYLCARSLTFTSSKNTNMSTSATFPITDYIKSNLESFNLLIENLDYKALQTPLLTAMIERMASFTDSTYNSIYGGEPVSYAKGGYVVPFEDHFTDDLFTALLLVLLPNEDPRAVVHLAWTFGRMVTLTPEGPKAFKESKAVGVMTYGEKAWQQTTLRDRQHQFVPFADLGEEQKKDDIPLRAFTVICGENREAISRIILSVLSADIRSQLKFTL